MNQQAHGCNIRDGIHGTDFMEMDLFHRNTVDMTFRIRNFLINSQNIQLHRSWNPQSADDIANATQALISSTRSSRQETATVSTNASSTGKDFTRDH